MKILKSLILTVILAGAVRAGDIPQPVPSASPAVAQQTTKAVVKELLVVICQSLLSLR
jgi:hypothetical protein